MKNKRVEAISLAEAARLLSVSERTVRRLVDRGELRSHRIGSALTVRLDSLPGEGPLLSLHEAAECLACSPNELRGLLREGLLTALPVGSLQRFALGELEARRAEIVPRLVARRAAE